MAARLDLGGISVDLMFKDIKNVHLSVYPPTGRVCISAPRRLSVESVRAFAISKLGWIKRQQRRLREQSRETPREYLDRESHYLWGKRYLLRVIEGDHPSVAVKHSRLLLRVNLGATEEKKHGILAEWYREQMKTAVSSLIARWATVIGVTVEKFYVQQMKTKWGSCNPLARSVRLNTELAKKPKDCLEYIVVHEMTHLLEPTHNARFIATMDRVMPDWRLRRDQLNQLPVRHEEWRC
jgi:predicted metal-dependent hydrolase